jgi:serine/threonine-protein kinase
MSSQSWDRIESLYEQARQVPPEERAAFLREHCEDASVRDEVASLLDAREQAPSFFRDVAAEAVDPLIKGVEEAGEGEAFNPPDLTGRQVGPYRLVEEIGTGGMGIVYRAERVDGKFERTVAVKLLRRRLHGEEAVRRFRTEGQVLATLDHPNIAQLLDGGVTENGRPYLVMELVDGVPLTTYADDRNLGLDARLDLLKQVLAAVQAAHRQLVVHRDLKPSNVLVAETEDGPRVKLLDFGIAKLLDDSLPVTQPQTRTGQHLLTPAYAAPEQVSGKEITTATDVYQLGVLAYELMAGTRPFELSGKSLTEIERVLLNTMPREPSEAEAAEGGGVDRAQVRGDLDTIIMKALRKEPDRRYRSVEALASDLMRHRAGEPVEARRATFGYRAKKFVSRNRTTVAAGMLVVLLGVAYAVTVTIQADRLAEQRDRARTQAAKAEQVSDFLVDLIGDADPYATSGGEKEDPRVSTVMDRGAERIDELEGQPAVQAELRSVIGRIYDKVGEFEAAESMLTAALAQRRRLHEGPDSTVATTLYHLGLHHQLTGNYEQADSLLREALAMRRAVYGPDHPMVAEILGRLGSISWYNLGNYAAADSFLHEALRIRRAAYDSAHIQIATGLNDLANLYHRQGAYDRAAPYYRKAIAMYRRLEGDHPSLATIMSNFAALLRDRGAYAEADSIQRAALAIHRELTGPKSLDVALRSASLGRIRMMRGRLADADSLLIGGLNRLRTFYDPPHPYLARTEYHVGRLRLRQNRFSGAERRFRTAREQAEKALPPGHPVRANPLLGLGRLHLEQGRPAAAEPLIREALSLRKSAFGATNWMVAVAQGVLGRCLARQEQYEEAASLLRAAHETLRQKRPAGDPYREEVRTSLVALYDRWGKPQRADRYRASTNT